MPCSSIFFMNPSVFLCVCAYESERERKWVQIKSDIITALDITTYSCMILTNLLDLQAHAKRCNGGCFAHRYYKFFNFFYKTYTFVKYNMAHILYFFNLLIPKI